MPARSALNTTSGRPKLIKKQCFGSLPPAFLSGRPPGWLVGRLAGWAVGPLGWLAGRPLAPLGVVCASAARWGRRRRQLFSPTTMEAPNPERLLWARRSVGAGGGAEWASGRRSLAKRPASQPASRPAVRRLASRLDWPAEFARAAQMRAS